MDGLPIRRSPARGAGALIGYEGKPGRPRPRPDGRGMPPCGAAGKERMSELAQATKKALAASLKELLGQKPFHKITISDITEQCGVNRMTFYYHFHDIYDLAQWAFQEEAAALLDGSLSAEKWEDWFLSFLKELQRNRPQIVNICRSLRREELERRMCEVAEQALRPVLDQELGDCPVPEEDWGFVVHFYTYALVAILLEWIEDGMKTEPEVLARRLNTICSGGIRQAARNLQQN